MWLIQVESKMLLFFYLLVTQALDIGTILNLIFLILFFIFIVWGQRIQMMILLRDIEFAIGRLKLMKDSARNAVIERMKKFSSSDPSSFIDKVIEYVTIEPVSLDPSGIIWKYDYLLKTSEDRIKSEVYSFVSQAKEEEKSNLLNVLEVLANLNLLYKLMRHYYIMGKKTGSAFIIIQLQAILPEVLMNADALMGALFAFSYGHPVGDGVGALVAAKIMGSKLNETKEIARDTVFMETTLENRKLGVIKARGPGGTVGYPGDAIMSLLEREKYDLVVMVDAGLKLEGEKSGSIVEGVGAAIGGIGTEKYKIEEVVSKKGIPLYGVIVKMSMKEAITPMTEELYKASEQVIARVKEIIKEKVPEDGSMLLIGVGNTIGIR
ncbi:MAG: DUF1512 domain-containing protein [Candidatus Brockarchaeota archaeon]|nr:DUF1512 domain-containing protein [Candidatus Brockarchaeota archaeon]MBO3768447.1 DUF1512 domain-containing protein [Candidatus Brockarchaeota archaeon]